jgi:hypothetical protein
LWFFPRKCSSVRKLGAYQIVSAIGKGAWVKSTEVVERAAITVVLNLQAGLKK